MTNITKTFLWSPGHDDPEDVFAIHNDQHIYFSTIDSDDMFLALPPTIVKSQLTYPRLTTLGHAEEFEGINVQTIFFEIVDLEAVKQILQKMAA